MAFLLQYLTRINTEDVQRVGNEKERFVPLTASPFKCTGADDESAEDGRPAWLELAGDLVWTTTFASLTSNAQFTSVTGLWNYTAYFVLVWHLWETQMIYDLNYWCDDWFHRVCFALQLMAYGTLAAFSAYFQVVWGIGEYPTDPSAYADMGNSTAVAIQQAADEYAVRNITVSFIGMDYLLCANRIILLLQYLRVLVYKYRDRTVRGNSTIIPVATAISALIFLGCALLIQLGTRSLRLAWIQIILWGAAVAIQAVAQIVTMRSEDTGMASFKNVMRRLTGLTVIVFGEGLNGITQTLQFSINSLGFTHRVVGEGVALSLILYFLWLLYFDGYRTAKHSNKVIRDIWTWLHLPFHLLLILMIQCTKNVFLTECILQGSLKFYSKFQDALIQASQSGGYFVVTPDMTRTLEKVALSWEVEAERLNEALSTMNSTAGLAYAWRWYSEVEHAFISEYVSSPPSAGETAYQWFQSLNDTLIVDDILSTDAPLFNYWVNVYISVFLYSATVVLEFAGSVLICLGLLSLLRPDRDIFNTLHSTVRILGGTFLVVWGVQTIPIGRSDPTNIWLNWLLPTITFVGAGCAVLDWVVLLVSNLSLRSKAAVAPGLASPGETPQSTPGDETKGGSTGLFPKTDSSVPGSSRENIVPQLLVDRRSPA